MTERYVQVKNLRTLDALRTHLDGLGVELPIDDVVEPGGPLAAPVTIDGIGVAPNRFAVLPMEGWDGTADGGSTDLVRRRWARFGTSGAGVVWCEATAVRADGRANPNQLVIGEHLAELRGLLDPSQVCGLQLTHSGRWSKPRARTAHTHPELDRRSGTTADDVFTDDELDALAEAYVDAAVVAQRAGFHFVDVKHCHGYLLHELLGARNRTGRYADDPALFLRTVVEGIRDRAPGLGVAVRLSAFDTVPFHKGDGGVGEVVAGEHPRPFELADAHTFLRTCTALGITLVSVTGGSPYYNPHVQRPAYFPPSDGYSPPEDPLVGVARQAAAVIELAAAHPSLVLVASALSYLQDWLPNVAQAIVREHGVAMAGLGRMALSYPDLPADVLAGRHLDRGRICRTFSDCTTAPRNGLVSGCFPLDPFYKEHPQRVQLAAVKRSVRSAP